MNRILLIRYPRPNLAMSRSTLGVLSSTHIPINRIIQRNQQSYKLFSTYRSLMNRPGLFKPNRYMSLSDRVTKSQLLAQAPNSLSRLLVHIKWPLIRNNRPFSVDDFSALISWLVMGNVLWIILGTTTFGLVTMYSIHTFDNIWDTISSKNNGNDDDDNDNEKTISDQSILGYITGSILSQGLGIKFEFKKGSVLPEWKDGMLRFKNFDVFSLENNENSLDIHARIEAMNISLSFSKWYEGNGLIHDIEIYGMNANVYKLLDESSKIEVQQKAQTLDSMALSFSRYNDHYHDLHDEYLNDLQKHKQSQRTSFINPNYILSNIKIHDSDIELYNSKSSDVKPFKIAIFNCDLPKLRGDKLIIDFFNANNVTGAINDSMFTIHKKQQYNTTTNDRMVTFKLDGINLGSIFNTNHSLKFNWIHNGKAEIIANIRLPQLDDDFDNFEPSNYKFGKVFSKMFDELANVTSFSNSNPNQEISKDSNEESNPLIKSALAAIYETFKKDLEFENSSDQISSEYVLVNVKVKFSNLKASLPKQLPTASSTLIPFISLHDLRSLIAFINNYDPDNNKSPIIIKTTVIERLSELYNLQDLSQARIFDVIVGDIYEDLLKMVKWDEKRIIEQKSSLWSHSLASQLLLLGLGVLA